MEEVRNDAKINREGKEIYYMYLEYGTSIECEVYHSEEKAFAASMHADHSDIVEYYVDELKDVVEYHADETGPIPGFEGEVDIDITIKENGIKFDTISFKSAREAMDMIGNIESNNDNEDLYMIISVNGKDVSKKALSDLAWDEFSKEEKEEEESYENVVDDDSEDLWES